MRAPRSETEPARAGVAIGARALAAAASWRETTTGPGLALGAPGRAGAAPEAACTSAATAFWRAASALRFLAAGSSTKNW